MIGVGVLIVAAALATLLMRRRSATRTASTVPVDGPTAPPAEQPMNGLEAALAQVTDREGRPIRDHIDAETQHVDDLRVPDDTGPLGAARPVLVARPVAIAQPLVVGLVCALAALAFVTLRVLAHDGDVTSLIRIGLETADPASGSGSDGGDPVAADLATVDVTVAGRVTVGERTLGRQNCVVRGQCPRNAVSDCRRGR